MKFANSVWLVTSFFIGVFVCYISLQFSFFDIKKELDIPNIVLSIITLIIGFFIANTLQKRVNKNSNQHSFLVRKIDLLWDSFNKFSQKITYDDKLEAITLKDFSKNTIHPIESLLNVFESFEIKNDSLKELQEKLEKLEEKLSNFNAENNVLDISQNKVLIENDLLAIGKSFSIVMKKI